MSQKSDTLKLELQKMKKILLYSYDCYLYCFYFGNPGSPEEREYLDNSLHFSFFNMMLWRSAILELSKLLIDNNDTHKYNIHKLIRKFKPGGLYSKFGISENIASEWETMLTTNNQLIINLQTLRNEMIAHEHDKGIDYISINPELKEFKALMQMCIDIFQTIDDVVFGKSYHFDSFFFKSSDFNMVKILALEHKKELEKYFRK